VKVTEQLLADDSIQLLVLREPPVVPAIRAKLTLPPGILEATVVSVTVAVTVAVQLATPEAILQLTGPRLVDVVSFATVIVFDAGLVLPL
jgi:hypothetical protein